MLNNWQLSTCEIFNYWEDFSNWVSGIFFSRYCKGEMYLSLQAARRLIHCCRGVGMTQNLDNPSVRCAATPSINGWQTSFQAWFPPGNPQSCMCISDMRLPLRTQPFPRAAFGFYFSPFIFVRNTRRVIMVVNAYVAGEIRGLITTTTHESCCCRIKPEQGAFSTTIAVCWVIWPCSIRKLLTRISSPGAP